jgi:hypothetical protein
MSEGPTMVPEASRENGMFDGWEKLSWEERRERRIERWMRPAQVEFADESVRASYEERVQIIIDALKLRKPVRVPLLPQMGYYTTRYSGLTAKESMYDYEKLAKAWWKFHEDFRPDAQADAGIPGRPFDLLGGRFLLWPGHGVGDDTPWQYVEAEYMKAEDYDALIADPSGYFMRVLLPRFAEGFEPLAALDPFSDILEVATLPFNLAAFADPAVLEGVRRLFAVAEATVEFIEAIGTMNGGVLARLGLPMSLAGLVKAPYDILADTLRGTRGIVMDRYRRPEKILAAAERFVPLQIAAAVRQTAAADSPLVFIPLHKGADGFMSDADYREFYWPTLKAVLKGLIAEGIVPVLFAEGGYAERLPVIADDDLPCGSVMWWFDATDMKAAKRALGGYACIGGNVPGDLLALGTETQVEQYVTGLLDDVAGDGGFVLSSGAVIDDASPETLSAMLETARAWRG